MKNQANRDALAQLTSQPLALYRPALAGVLARVASLDPQLAAGLFSSPSKEQRAELAARREIKGLTRPGPKSGAVAVVPIHGVITQRDSLFTWLFGGTSCEWLAATVEQLINDDGVSTILLDVDSPGGSVAGVPEAASVIRAAAAAKNVIAISHSINASSAYWLSSGADEMVATPESMTGAVGVYMVHEDWSRALETEGITVTYIESARFKTEMQPEKELTDDARAHLQALVDESGRLFVDDVAAGRKVDASKIAEDFGQGTVFHARAAKSAGMVDRIATYQQTIARLTGSKASVTDVRGLVSVGEIPTPDEGANPPEATPEVIEVAPEAPAEQPAVEEVDHTKETESPEGATFTSRLSAVVAEAADLAAIARSRVDRRAGSRKPLSATHRAESEALRESLLAAAGSIEAVLAEADEPSPAAPNASRKRFLALEEARLLGYPS